MSMQRVSSRQRLVSWDAFDATNSNSQEDLDVVAGSDTESEGPKDEMSLKRKRGSFITAPSTQLNTSTQVHTVVPVDDESSPSPSSQVSPWSPWKLPTEVQLNILQYLSLDDLTAVTQTCSTTHGLLHSQEAVEAIWKPSFSFQWPWLLAGTEISTQLDDDAYYGSYGSRNNYTILPKLLAAAADHTSWKIDEKIFSRWSRSLRVYRPRGKLRSISDTTVQFTGQVGLGDRCVRANAPLSRPLRKHAAGGTTIFSRFGPARLACRQHRLLGQPQPQQHTMFRPFVSPFVTAANTVDVTPRFISYFEVSILTVPESTGGALQLEERPRLNAPTRHNHRHPAGRVAPECVAVGLATTDFSLHTRMPGWDNESYGYHGDDGGIFHGAGSMLKQYGSHFGVGDTVGCGVDYVRQAIFYCLNGEFLGYAFELKGKRLQQDLFPVVGMDTNCPVRCNFGTGEEPFKFDLEGMMAEHKDIVLHAMQQTQR